MRKYLFSAAALLLLTATQTHAQPKVKAKDDKMKMKDMDKSKDNGNNMPAGTNMTTANSSNMDYPYTAEYSSKFEIGNPKDAKMILNLWKDYEDNKLKRHVDYFSDTVSMLMADGTVLHGIQNVGTAVQQQRAMYDPVKTTVIAWMPLKSVDKNENWVSIWGQMTATDKNGKATTTRVNEVWHINKAGKIDYMEQVAGKVPERNQ